MKGKTPILGLDHVQLAAPAGCEVEARRFYGKVLGLPELAKPALLQGRGGCWFQCGAHQLHIGVEAEFRPARKAHPALLTGNLAELEEVLTSNRIAFERDHSIPGTSRIYVSDPFGNRLEFVEAMNEAGRQPAGGRPDS